MVLLLLALSGALAASTVRRQVYYDDTVEVPHKRAALVLDRLLVALQSALREDSSARRFNRIDSSGPRTAPLRVEEDFNDLGALHRRDDGVNGRAIQCYFNPVTCF
ncbi:uncharacterized protein LOC113498736 isoform X2 [Trichoplusia ni]|nr:uncharacterized protein LOC113498736 isoform X2 [Trichoplusia ni]